MKSVLSASVVAIVAVLVSLIVGGGEGAGYRVGYWAGGMEIDTFKSDWKLYALTHVVYIGFLVNADASIQERYTPNLVKVRDSVRSAGGMKFVLAVGTGNRTLIDQLLTSRRAAFLSNLLDSVRKWEFEGLSFDLEYPHGVNSITNQRNDVLYHQFSRDLRAGLKAMNATYELSAAVTPWPYDQGDCCGCVGNSTMADVYDQVLVMGYDMIPNQRGYRTGSQSPFNSTRRFDLVESVASWRQWFPAEKVVMLLPFYGYDYTTNSPDPNSTVLGDAYGSPAYAYMSERDAPKYGRLWDPETHGPWYRYSVGTVWHQVWYDDAESLGLKYRWLMNEGVGFGVFALRYERNWTNIWSVLQPESSNCQCSVAGPCCDGCTFRSSSTVCRPSTASCDPAESCTGSSATCPADANTCQQPTADALAMWKFNEGSGLTTADSSGNGLTGKLVSMSSRQWVTGVSGRGLRFLNNAGVVTVEDASRKLAPLGDVSFSVWLKFSSLTGSDQPLLKNGAYQLYHRSASSPVLHFLVTVQNKTAKPGDSSWDGTAGVVTNTLFKTYRWTHVVGVRSGDDLKVYVNGKLDKTVACMAGQVVDASSATTMTMGKFAGTMDEVTVFSGALTQAQVTAEFSKYSGRTETDEPDEEDDAPSLHALSLFVLSAVSVLLM